MVEDIARAVRNIDPAQGKHVLDVLLALGPRTVPSIARALDTSRQNIQISSNRLAHSGLVTWQPNESHQRSKLLTLTEQGRAEALRIVEAEKEAFAALDAALTKAEVETCAQALSKILQTLKGEQPTHLPAEKPLEIPKRTKPAQEKPKPPLPDPSEDEPLPVNLL